MHLNRTQEHLHGVRQPCFGARLLAMLVLEAVAACAPGSGRRPAAQVASGIEHCGPTDNIDVNDKEYVVQTNEWNSTERQCLRVHDATFTMTEANFTLPAAGAPASYPSIYKGCHWGYCTNRSGLPRRVSTLPNVRSRWTVAAPHTGAYDVAYDLWFNKTPTTSGQPDGAELMIWLDRIGGIRPSGSQVGTATIAGATWNVWISPPGRWTYIAYVRDPPAESADLDLRAFTTDAVTRGAIDPAWYLIDIEAGFEIWRGGAGLATTSFSAVIGDR